MITFIDKIYGKNGIHRKDVGNNILVEILFLM